MDITHLLSFVKKTFCRIINLWSITWITSAVSLRQGTCTQKNTQSLPFSEEEQYAEHDELREEMEQVRDLSTSSLRRLSEVEKHVEKLESDLCGEMLLWSSRYQELQRDQQLLKDQLHEKKPISCHQMEDAQGVASVMESDVDVPDGHVEPLRDVMDVLHRHLGDLVNTSAHGQEDLPPTDGCSLVEGSVSHSSCLSRPGSIVSYPGSANGLKCQKSFRVFAPRSPLELKTGHRVKVLLPSARIGTGVVYYVGQLPGKVEFHVGVVLEDPECGSREGVFAGHCVFHW
ncbi:hypothetical protein FKM82_013734 [Ascaphus truei]